MEKIIEFENSYYKYVSYILESRRKNYHDDEIHGMRYFEKDSNGTSRGFLKNKKYIT